MSSYWQKRQDQLNSSLEKDEAALKKRLLKAYEREAAKLDKEIAAYYQKYGRDNVIEYVRLFEQLSADDIKLLIERMDDFAKKYPQYADLLPVRESVYQLNRLEGLKESVLLHQYEIGAITNAQLQEHLSKLYFTNSKAAAKAVGLTENESIIKNFVNTAWAGSKDYSQRIWQNAEKLAEYLNNAGFKVTQATVSRDIRDLKLTKVSVSGGRQKYVVHRQEEPEMNEKYIRVLRDGYVSMDKAQNILVIKTVSGMAMAVAAAVDAMKWHEVVGCIAGDDTIMCAIRTAEDTSVVMEKIRRIVSKGVQV